MWRSLIEFRAYGFKVIPRTSQLPATWRFRQTAYLAFRESISLPWYILRQIAPPATLTPDTKLASLLQEAQQYGQQRLYLDQEGIRDQGSEIRGI